MSIKTQLLRTKRKVSKASAMAISIGVIAMSITSSVMAAVPNVFTPSTPARASEVNQNFSDLDTRVTDLENNNGLLSSEQVFVTVDCDLNPNFFLEAPFTTTAAPNTNYDIFGTCNGPVLIRDDNVTLSAGSTESTIVLPAGLTFETSPIEFLVAVYVFGANNVQINNLRLDATAYSAAEFDNTNSGALFVRNGLAKLESIVAQGGAFTISALDNATIRSQGILTVNDFYNQGLSARHQSNIIVDGTAVFSSNSSTSNGADVITASDSGHIDIRGALSIVSSPETSRSSLLAEEDSYLRIRDGEDTALPGGIAAIGNSRILVNNVSFDGNASSLDDSSVFFNNVRQTGGETAIFVDGSRLQIEDAGSSFDAAFELSAATTVIGNATVTGPIFARAGSYLSIGGAMVNDVELDNSRVSIDDTTIDGPLRANNGSTLQVTTGNQTTTQSPGLELNGSSTALIGSSTTLSNEIHVNQGSFLSLNNVTLSGSPTTMEITNSRATITNSTTGFSVLEGGSSVVVENGQTGGFDVFGNSSLLIDRTTVNGDIGLYNSGLSAFGTGLPGAGTFNSNTVFLCGNQLSVSIEGLDLSAIGSASVGLAASGTISEGCRDGSEPPVPPFPSEPPLN